MSANYIENTTVFFLTPEKKQFNKEEVNWNVGWNLFEKIGSYYVVGDLESQKNKRWKHKFSIVRFFKKNYKTLTCVKFLVVKWLVF